MPESLVRHVVLRSHLAAQVVWDNPAHRDEHERARREGRAPAHWPHEVHGHVEAVPGHDEPGAGITVHRPAPWRCSCGVELALDWREVPDAWATHAARRSRLPEDVLAAHMLVDVYGVRSTAVCGCGQEFPATDNPTDGDEAVRRWAEHVAEVAA